MLYLWVGSGWHLTSANRYYDTVLKEGWCDGVTTNIDYVICQASATSTMSNTDVMIPLKDLTHCAEMG